MFFCIKNFLSNRSLKVRIGSVHSTAYPQEEGLPQGSVLSPTLFNIAINSLFETVPIGVQGLAYADDFAIISSKSTAVEACHYIQRAINAATAWARSRGFRFSPEKTQAIRFFRTRRREEVPTLFLNGSILPYEENLRYLGLFFYKRLTFEHHINETISNVKKRMNILKVVSNFNWGADRTTLLRLYKALCLSKIEYGCQIYGSASKTILKKLDVVHNLALRICTGAYRTSPIDSLYVESEISPLFIRREKLGLRYMSRVLASKQNPNYKFVSHPIDRAHTKPKLPKPLEVRLDCAAREIELIPSIIAEIFPPKIPPWCRPPLKICYIKEDKKSCSDVQLRSLFLEHMSKHRASVSIYTDGSKSFNGVGCAVITPNSIVKKRLPNQSSVFTAELLAVLFSLKFIFNSNSSCKNYTIFTDSLSALSSLRKSFPSNNLVQEIQDWLALSYIHRKIKVEFCWVPSHVGIDGNERADAAAKAATISRPSTSIKIPLPDIKRSIGVYSSNRWQEHWASLPDNLKLKSLRPSVLPWNTPCESRRSSIVLTRLRIGHTFLTHKYLMSSGVERQAPRCPACHEVVSVRHILIDCPFYNSARRNNLLMGYSISGILEEGAPVERVFKFLKEIGLFYDI